MSRTITILSLPEVSVSHEPDVAQSVHHFMITPQSSLTPAQTVTELSVSLSAVRFPPLPSVCQALTELNTPHITPESFVSGPAASIDNNSRIEPLPAVLRFIKISVRFYNFRAPICVKVKESLIVGLVEDFIINTCPG